MKEKYEGLKNGAISFAAKAMSTIVLLPSKPSFVSMDTKEGLCKKWEIIYKVSFLCIHLHYQV